jgi:microcystin degradation protein MlrC
MERFLCTADEEEYTEIKAVEDCARFCGRFVVVKSASHYWTSKRRVPMVAYQSLYHKNFGPRGVNLVRLLSAADVPSTCGVTPDTLKRHKDLRLRRLRADEADEIAVYLLSHAGKDAFRFEYDYDDGEGDILVRGLPRHLREFILPVKRRWNLLQNDD